MRQGIKICALLGITVALTGCARLTSVMRKYDATRESIAIDAKQRVVISGAPRTLSGTGTRVVPVICAEPSPDALSALAASGGASLSRESYSAATNLALSEAAGSIGLRTQSIQLMRDAMYRLCEGYMANAISAEAFEIAHRRFQNSMVSILAVEQLTGTVRAPTIVLGGSATSGNADKAAEYTEKASGALAVLRTAEADAAKKKTDFDSARKAREDLEKEQVDIKTKAEADRTAQEKTRWNELPGLIAAAKQKEDPLKLAYEDAEKARVDREQLHKGYEQARLAALSGGGAATSIFDIGGAAENRSEGAIKAVADSIQTIVKDTFSLQWSYELCTTALLKTDNAGANLRTKCENYLDATREAISASAKAEILQNQAYLERIQLASETIAKLGTGVSADTLTKVIDAIGAPPPRSNPRLMSE